jgi:hypothetical protein
MRNCKQCKKEIEKPKKFCDKACYVEYLTARAIKGGKKLSTIKAK